MTPRVGTVAGGRRQAYFFEDFFFVWGTFRRAWDSRGVAFLTPDTGVDTGSLRAGAAGGGGGRMLSFGAGTTSGGWPERWRFSSSSEWKSWIWAPPRSTSSPFWFSAQRSSSAK